MHWSTGDVIAAIAVLLSYWQFSRQAKKDREATRLQQAQEMTVLTAAVHRLDFTMQQHNRTLDELSRNNAETKTALQFIVKSLDQLTRQRFRTGS